MPAYAPSRTRPSAPPRRKSVEQRPQPVAAAPALAIPTGIVFALVIGIAAAAFGLQLSRSSLFIDEVYSWQASRGSIGDMIDALKYSEVTPPLYYVFLHGWVGLTGDGEFAMRLPSVLAGVGLVAAVYWLANIVAGKRAALISGCLAALSPLLLLYAQQVRAYIFVMLAVTVAVAAVLQATQDRSTRMYVVAGVAAALAVLFHYTAVLILGPLAIWMWLRPGVSPKARFAFSAAIVLPLLALAPLALEQLSQGHHDKTESYASLTTFNALRLAGTPFDGRAGGQMMVGRELGAVVIVQVLALLAIGDRFRTVRHRHLLVALAVIPLAAVLVLSTIQPMALTRYTAVAAPFLLVGIGAVIAHAHKALGAVVLTGALAASAIGLVAAQKQDGQFPNTREAVSTVAANWQQGDQFVSVGLLGFDGALAYYGEKEMPSGQRKVPAYPSLAAAVNSNEMFDAAMAGRRLWFVSDPVMSKTEIDRTLSTLGYKATMIREYPGSGRIQLGLAERLK